MRLHKIMDTQGFDRPIEALSLLAPSDWEIEGRVDWVASLNCTQDMIRVHVTATAPDGLTGFEFFPTQSWQWSEDPMANQLAAQGARQGGCAVQRPFDAAGFLRMSFLPAARPLSEVIAIEPMPDLAAAAESELRSGLAMMLQAGLIRDARATAARAIIGYDVRGTRMQEWINASVGVTTTRTMSPGAMMRGQLAEMTHRGFTASNIFAARGPAGSLERNAALFATIFASIRPNDRWASAVRQAMLGINQAAIDGAAELSRILARHNREMMEIITRGYEQRQAVQDRMHDQFSRYIRGVERYVDPSGRGVDLSAGYRYVWGNGMGEYILTDDPWYDPARTSGQKWTRLDKVR
jgi:hypothetical protein